MKATVMEYKPRTRRTVISLGRCGVHPKTCLKLLLDIRPERDAFLDGVSPMLEAGGSVFVELLSALPEGALRDQKVMSCATMMPFSRACTSTATRIGASVILTTARTSSSPLIPTVSDFDASHDDEAEGRGQRSRFG